MERYTTIMIVPEREKDVKTFRIPRILFRSFAFLFVIFAIVLSILLYDYWKVLEQVYANKQLIVQNRQLKEQIQLFQMKINSLSDDLGRIRTFEKKLRVITGVDTYSDRSRRIEQQDMEIDTDLPSATGRPRRTSGTSVNPSKDLIEKETAGLLNFQNYENDSEFQQLKTLYDQKIAQEFGLSAGFSYTKNWTEQMRRNFSLAKEYAFFDFRYNRLKSMAQNVEKDIHEIDQKLLDRDSFLKSTPTLMPTHGWITSYFGPRLSPTSGRIKMHEGVDIGAPIGRDIVAPADGIITFAGKKFGFGKFVQIDHGYGIETIFGHNKTVNVRNGQLVKRGQVIAKVGNTGMSTGPHVHYEVRVNGIAVDPLYFILN